MMITVNKKLIFFCTRCDIIYKDVFPNCYIDYHSTTRRFQSSKVKKRKHVEIPKNYTMITMNKLKNFIFDLEREFHSGSVHANTHLSNFIYLS